MRGCSTGLCSAVVFTLAPLGVPWDQSQIAVKSLETVGRRVLTEGGRDVRYLPTGHLEYAQAGTLLAVPFDVKLLEVSGGFVPLVESVMDAGNSTGAAHFTFSHLGSLVYVPAPTPGLCIGSCHEATKAPENRAVGFSPRARRLKPAGPTGA